MISYFDKYGRIHDKPCLNGEPSSNNGWIYTAYYKKLTGYSTIDPEAANVCCDELVRSPNKPVPPISRDEILGLVYLGFLLPGHLDGWSFSPYKVPEINPFKLIKQLWEMRNQDRNYFWKNDLDQIYRFAFSVPLVDRHFILQCWGQFNILYWAIAKIDSMINSSNRSSRAIAWLKYDKPIEELRQYFTEQHPVNAYVEKLTKE